MTSTDLKNKTRSGYKLRANCPGCCPDTRGRATFHQGWGNDNDPNADEIGAPVWRCGNCNFEVARRVRMSPGQAALRRLRNSEVA